MAEQVTHLPSPHCGEFGCAKSPAPPPARRSSLTQCSPPPPSQDISAARVGEQREPTEGSARFNLHESCFDCDLLRWRVMNQTGKTAIDVAFFLPDRFLEASRKTRF